MKTEDAPSEVCEHPHLQVIRGWLLCREFFERGRRTGAECYLSARERLWKQNFCKLSVIDLAVGINVSKLQRFIDLLLRERITESDEDVPELLSVDFAGVVLVENFERVEDGLFFLLKRLPASGHHLST